MTRPRKATVDYFPHDVVHGKTLYILESQFGNDGYASWFKILERLGASDGHYIDLRDKAAMLHLSAYCRVSAETLTEILNLLSELEAIDRDLWRGNVVFSWGLVHRVTDAYRKRINNLPTKDSITKSLNIVYPAENTVSGADTDVSGVGNPQREREREREREINTTSSSKRDQELISAFHDNRERLAVLFPSIDLDIAFEKMLATRSKSQSRQFLNPYEAIIKWMQMEFKPKVQTAALKSTGGRQATFDAIDRVMEAAGGA